MTKSARAEARAVIAAPADRVYAILSDYRDSHPQILPRSFFTGLEVESGGQGAGTVVRVRARMLGVERELRMAVSEPEPGRVLSERDINSDLVTTFTVIPQGHAACEVIINTLWTSQRGMAGAIERWIVPRMFRRVYRQELILLAATAAKNA